MLIYIEKGFRSFHEFSIGSLGQRTAKNLAVKVGGLKKNSAAWPEWSHTFEARVWIWPGPDHSQSGNFAALWLTDPLLMVWKDLNTFSMFIGSSISWQQFKALFFSLEQDSFISIYLLRGWFVLVSIFFKILKNCHCCCNGLKELILNQLE